MEFIAYVIGVLLRFLADVGGGLGQFLWVHASSIVTWVLGIFGLGIAHFLGRRKIRQDEEKHRESHTLELFNAVSNSNAHLQLAAASVLVERWKRLKKIEKKMPIDSSEEASIEQALHSILKTDGDPPADVPTGALAKGVSPHLSKFVAEQIVRVNEAQPLVAGRPPNIDTPEGKRAYSVGPKGKVSPLKRLDWQKVRVIQAWWAGLDARDVDFFDADLLECGMRYAHLNKAVFYKARLCKTRFGGADLTEANFYEADVADVDFREANLSRADLSQAKNWESATWTHALYCAKTKFPVGFVPDQHKMRLLDSKS